MSEAASQPKPRRVVDILLLADGYLRQKECEAPRLGAEMLLAHVLETTRLQVYLRFEETLSDAQIGRYRELIRRRGCGEPVAYLVGEKEFYSLPFRVDDSVLIPRPETETLVELVLHETARRGPEAPRVLDLGTGPGTVLLALAAEMRHGTFVGTDISPRALELAETNRGRLVPGLQVSFHPGNWFQALPEGENRFNIVVSNPPYVPAGEIDALAVEISKFEPRGALDGGPDGLNAYRTLAAGLGDWLADDGFAALEIGDDQGKAVADLFGVHGFSVDIRKDGGNRDRVVLVRRVEG